MYGLGTKIMLYLFRWSTADGHTSSDNMQANRVADKIWPLTCGIYALKCGSAADTQFLLQITKSYIGLFGVEYSDKTQVKVAARILQQYQYKYKDYLSCTVIVCGVDNLEGACIYEVRSGC